MAGCSQSYPLRLDALGVEIYLLDGEGKDALKQHNNYSASVSGATNLGIGQ